MVESPEIIDRERPGVPYHKSRLDQLEEAARQYERVKKARARNTWEKREQAYGTPEEIQKASRVLEASLKYAGEQTNNRYIQEALNEKSITAEDAERLHQLLDKSVSTNRHKDSAERE